MNHKQLLNSQIKNHRILGFGATQQKYHKRKQEANKDKTDQGTQEKQQHPKRRRQDTTAQQSYLKKSPNFSSLVRRNSYIILPSLLRTRHVLFDPCSSTIARLLTTVLLLLLLRDMFPVAAGIAERVGGAAALFKVIVFFFSCFLSFYIFIVYFPSSRTHFLPSLAMFIQLLLF